MKQDIDKKHDIPESDIDYSFVRSKKATAMKKWYEKSFEKKSSLEIIKLKEAVILPLKKFANDPWQFGRGGCVDRSGNYVELSAIKNRIYGTYQFEETTYKDEKVVYCGYLINQWGHFLVEAVARLWYLQKEDSSIDKYVFFINYEEEGNIKGNYKEFFELIGIWDKIEIINRPTKFREVIVPELSFARRSYWSDEYKQIFNVLAKNIIIRPEWNCYKKVFLSRGELNKSGDDKEYNADMLDDFFLKNDYAVIYPEKISLSYLIYILQNADVIATMSGSVQHNLLFAPDRKKEIILEKTVVTVDFTIDINIMKKFETIYIDSNMCIYPVNIGYGPYIYTYHGYLEEFALKYGLKPVEAFYENPARMKKILKKYMKIYRKEYGYKWYINDWELQFIDSIKQACDEGYQYFEVYLSREKPFLFQHYFMFHYWKQFISHVLHVHSVL